jgi:hypothetical protein
MLRPTVSRPVLSWCQAPIWGPRPDFYYCQTLAGLLMWSSLSVETTGLSFTIAADPRQHSLSRVRVPRDSWPYFSVSGSRLPQPWGPSPHYLYSPGTGWPSYTPRHWVPFSVQSTAAGPRQHSRSWFQDPSGPTTKYLFFSGFYVFSNGASSLTRGRVWLLLVTPHLLRSDSAISHSHLLAQLTLHLTSLFRFHLIYKYSVRTS